MAFKTSSRLFVGNLNKEINKHEIKLKFENHGPVSSVWLSLRSPRFAFVEFENVNDAVKARSELNGLDIKGSCIRVEFSREKIPNPTYSEHVDVLNQNPIHEKNNNWNVPNGTPLFDLRPTANSEVKHVHNNSTIFRTRNFYNSNRFKSRHTGELNSSHISENVTAMKTNDVK